MRCAVWSSQDGWGWHSEVTFPAERDLPWGSSLGVQLGSAAGEAVVGWQQIPPGTVLVPLYFREMSNNVHFHTMYVLNIVLQEELKIAAVSLLLFLCTQSIFLNCLTCGGCGTPAEQLGDTFGAIGGMCLGLDAHFPAAHKYVVMWRNLSLFSRHHFFNTKTVNFCK